MIVILCDSFEDVIICYDLFISYLEENDPWSIRYACNAAYYVDTDDDIRWLFIDYRMVHLFDDVSVDVIDQGRFFAGLDACYGMDYWKCRLA